MRYTGRSGIDDLANPRALALSQRLAQHELSRPLDGLIKAFAVDGLEQVADRVGLERGHRVFIISGGEDDKWQRGLFRKGLQHLNTGQPRHLHVQKDQVRPQSLDVHYGLKPITGLADDLDLSMRAEQFPQAGSRRSLVVYD